MALITKPKYGKTRKLLIFGAGDAGELIGKEILGRKGLGYKLVAFVDDSPKKIGKKLLNVPILGPTDNIKKIVKQRKVDEILIAIPSASGEVIKNLVHECEETNTEIQILPGYFGSLEFLEKRVAGFEEVRPVSIEDFFRKKQVITDLKAIKESFFNKSILVTGAAGSIGSELCRQLLEFSPQKLIALDQAESPMYDLIVNLKKQHKSRFVPSIGDIRDKEKMRKIFLEHKPDIIFHAAAYKHVPLMEDSVDEAIKTNVFGTKNILDLACEFSVKDFILISTDKAVNPESVMGSSKKLTEMLVQSMDKNCTTDFRTVRFGNVLNSQGSVVPLFKKQIQEGGPVTITHPEMERFFMTIPEAVQLVIQVPLLGNPKDLFVLDMGEQIKILEIAEEMIKLEGFKPYKDINIEFVGLRPGEKLSEELHYSEEKISKTENEKIFLVKSNEINQQELQKGLGELSECLGSENNLALRKKLMDLVLGINLKQEEVNIPYNKPSIGPEEIAEEIDTLKSGWITMGPKTIQFEKDIAEYTGSKHAISVNSCTAGLHLSLVACDIKPGDEVITTPFTFAATANEIAHFGAKPVFVDIDPITYNIDPKKIEKKITKKTKAIMVVHYAGQACDMRAIDRIATKHKLKIIEDAAHAIGSEYAGKKIGSFGTLTNFSFYATKNMTTGEGGAITTNDDKIAERLRILRLHGISQDAWKRYGKGGSWFYKVEECGFKYNMSDMQAALGIHQLRKLDSFIKRRQEIAEKFDLELSKISGIVIPRKKPNRNHIYHIYPILLKNYDRGKFIEKLSEKGIGTSVHFIPLHLQPAFKKFKYKKGDFPITEAVYKRIVSLPLYPSMTDSEVDYVTKCIKEILENN